MAGFLNSIPIEEIKVGMTASYSQTITDSDIKAFAGISGDRNPVHLDEGYAKQSRFKNRIAHGMFTASFFSAIFGTKIPGEGCVYTHQSLNFKKPVYINDTVVASIEVVNIDLNSRRVKFKTVCAVNGSIVTDGEAEIYIPMTFRKILINDTNELLKFKEQLFALFKSSFDREMDEGLWSWAYIDNPNGNPIVSLYFDKERLIGHYAVIPTAFKYKNEQIKAMLSMTTMVDVSYRKYSVFIDQSSEVYTRAHELGYKLVYGFPNKKSAPGFKKRLGWVLDENLCIANLDYGQLMNLDHKKDNLAYFDIDDKKNLEWRLSKPSQNYFYNGKNILKKFNDECDVVFADGDFVQLDKDKRYNILIDTKICSPANRRNEYYFGYKILDDSLSNIVFKKDLLMSDVF